TLDMENSGAETGRGNWRIGARRARFCSGGDACTLPQEPEVSGAFLKYGNAPRRPHWLAGAPGFEPGNGGIKIRCLTTWLRPIAPSDCRWPRGPVGRRHHSGVMF